MKVLCFGSINKDYVYHVENLVLPGETIFSKYVSVNLGGKGANQAIALAKAGCNVFFAGNIGTDGNDLLSELSSCGVDISLVREISSLTGNAMIQVDAKGQNSIILFSGSNIMVDSNQIDNVFEHFSTGDWLVIQNEINKTDEIIVKAKQKGMKICFNPAPFDTNIFSYPLSDVDLLVVNEHEGAAIAEMKITDTYDEILETIVQKYPKSSILLTLGNRGSVYQGKEGKFFMDIVPSPVVDTTAAGDTFIGYFVSALTQKKHVEEALKIATVASSITVSREGAGISIPTYAEVEERSRNI